MIVEDVDPSRKVALLESRIRFIEKYYVELERKIKELELAKARKNDDVLAVAGGCILGSMFFLCLGINVRWGLGAAYFTACVCFMLVACLLLIPQVKFNQKQDKADKE